jgi:hypothetical protein
MEAVSLNSSTLNIDIPAGSPATTSKIKRALLLTFNILNYLTVTGNGRLIVDGSGYWTIHINPSSFSVAGTPGLFKSPQLIGWEKATSSSAWSQMSYDDMITQNPTRLWTSFVDGTDAYPWYGLRLTYDYVRGIP